MIAIRADTMRRDRTCNLGTINWGTTGASSPKMRRVLSFTFDCIVCESLVEPCL